MKTCTKTYLDIPIAHRAPNHDGHCALIHGHNLSCTLTFYSEGEVDKNGFVLDFGKMNFIKEWIKEKLDHRLLLNASDPLLPAFDRFLTAQGIQNITEVPDCSCEGLAQFFFDEINKLLQIHTAGKVRVLRVELHEDSKNSADYTR